MRKISFFLLQLCVSLTALPQNNILHITEEFPLRPAKLVEINNKRNVDIVAIPWTNSTVKIDLEFDTLLVRPLGDANKLSSWGFEIKQTKGRLIITCDPVNLTATTYHFKATVYFPKQRKLVIENLDKGDVILPEDVEQASIVMNGGSLRAKAISKLKLTSVLSEIDLGSIDMGTIDINGGQLSIQKINELNIVSRYTTPKIKSAKAVKLVSTADRYSIEEVETLTGAKKFGSCHIGLVKRKILLTGTGIGLELADISPEAELIRINTVNDSLRLFVKNLVNYSVNIIATDNSDVLLTDAIRNGNSNSKVVAGALPGMLIFKSNIGDTKQKHVVFDITCSRSFITFE
jgi:hypothetical protein